MIYCKTEFVCSHCSYPLLFQGLLWCSEVHHGERCQGLWGRGVRQAEGSEGQVHEVCGRSDDPQRRPSQLLRRHSRAPRPAEAGWVQLDPRHSSNIKETTRLQLYLILLVLVELIDVLVGCYQVCSASRWRSCCPGTPAARLAPRSPCPTTSASWSPRRRPIPPHPFLSRRGPSQRCLSCPREHLYPPHKKVGDSTVPSVGLLFTVKCCLFRTDWFKVFCWNNGHHRISIFNIIMDPPLCFLLKNRLLVTKETDLTIAKIKVTVNYWGRTRPALQNVSGIHDAAVMWTLSVKSKYISGSKC